MNFSVLPPAATADPLAASLAGGNKKNGQAQPPPTGWIVTGTLAVTYSARTRAGRSLDAEPVTVRYKEEINAASRTKELLRKIPLPGRSKNQPEDDPRTLADVEQILVDRTVERIAARLVNTNERVEALLARGALDEANRYAEAGQWTEYVEKLETMPPLPGQQDDAYRLYNIGLGNEALGYQAESPVAARRYFEQAVIDYRKAGEANPHEKYFLEPINRIEIALEHYKKLAVPADTEKKAPAKSPAKAVKKGPA